MSQPQTDNSTGAGPAGGEVRCARCGTANPGDARRCRECQAHLFVRCPRCAARNHRTAETCAACGKPMVTPPLARLRHRLKSKRARRIFRMTRLVCSALVIVLLILLGLYFSIRW